MTYRGVDPLSAYVIQLEATSLEEAEAELREALRNDLEEWARYTGQDRRSRHTMSNLYENDEPVTTIYVSWHPPEAERCNVRGEHDLVVIQQRAAGAALEITELCGACGLQITTIRRCQCSRGPGDGSPHTCRIVEQPEYVVYVSADPADYGDIDGQTSPEEGLRIAYKIASALADQFPWLEPRIERPGEFTRDSLPEPLAEQVDDWLDQHWLELVDEALAE